MSGGDTATKRELDEWDKLAEQNTLPDAKKQTDTVVPLPLVAAQVERFYGAAWYHNPLRWETTDGYVPFLVAIDAWRTMQSLMAWERLTLSKAVSLAMPHDEAEVSKWEAMLEADTTLAFPSDDAGS